MTLSKLLIIINNERKRKMKINIAILFRILAILSSFSLFLSLLRIFNPASVSVDGPVREIQCENCKPQPTNSLSLIKSKLSFGDKENFLDQLCPIISPLLVGLAKVDLSAMSMNDERMLHDDKVILGGSYIPKECRSRHKVAIIVPYRNRPHQLPIFLRHMHPFLQRQQLTYTIFVIEQTHTAELNRGALKNIGFMQALRGEFYECFFFHDIDYLPEDDHNLYVCPKTPKRMALLQSDKNYKSMGPDFFGGVVGFPMGDFAKVNGYSNLFWGWGGEDNDLLQRVQYLGINVRQLSSSAIHFSRYTLQPHLKDKPSPIRHHILDLPLKYAKFDGLSSLKYRLIRRKLEPLYTHVLVDLEKGYYYS